VQILIYDAVQVKKIARPTYNRMSERRFATWHSSFIFTPLGERFDRAVSRRPRDVDGEIHEHNTTVFVSTHRSGLTWIRRLPTRDTESTRKLLGKILRMYHTEDLIKDLLIYKTYTPRQSMGIEYPYKIVSEGNKPEYWFITGTTDWINLLRMFRQYPNFYQNGDDYGESVYEMSEARAMGISEDDLRRVDKLEDGAFRDGNRKFWNRLNWINLIRTNYNLNMFAEIGIQYGPTRYGFAMYKDGRAYRWATGQRAMNDVIHVHPRRNIDAFPLDTLYFNAYTHPDYVDTEEESEHTYVDDDGVHRVNRMRCHRQIIGDNGEVLDILD